MNTVSLMSQSWKHKRTKCVPTFSLRRGRSQSLESLQSPVKYVIVSSSSLSNLKLRGWCSFGCFCPRTSWARGKGTGAGWRWPLHLTSMSRSAASYVSKPLSTLYFSTSALVSRVHGMDASGISKNRCYNVTSESGPQKTLRSSSIPNRFIFGLPPFCGIPKEYRGQYRKPT